MCEKSNLQLRGIFITNECLTNRVNYTNSPVDEGGKSSLFIILPTLSILISPSRPGEENWSQEFQSPSTTTITTLNLQITRSISFTTNNHVHLTLGRKKWWYGTSYGHHHPLHQFRSLHFQSMFTDSIRVYGLWMYKSARITLCNQILPRILAVSERNRDSTYRAPITIAWSEFGLCRCGYSVQFNRSDSICWHWMMQRMPQSAQRRKLLAGFWSQAMSFAGRRMRW